HGVYFCIRCAEALAEPRNSVGADIVAPDGTAGGVLVQLVGDGVGAAAADEHLAGGDVGAAVVAGVQRHVVGDINSALDSDAAIGIGDGAGAGELGTERHIRGRGDI